MIQQDSLENSQLLPKDRPRVLVADDDTDFRNAVQYSVRRCGFDVRLASDGVEAWGLLQAEDVPTIALLDWTMPGLDGVELCRRIRALNRRHYVYVILLTARYGNHHVADCLKSGADEYVSKPFVPAALEARLLVAERIVSFQARLIVAQERLALAEGGGRSGSFNLDLKKGEMSWSPGVEQLYGLEPGKFPGTYKAWQSLVLPEDRQAVRNATREAFKTGEFTAEWRIRRSPEDQIRWIGGRARVFCDEAGRPSHIVGINLDITAQKLAEKKLKEQAALLDLAHDAIFVLTMEARIVFWSRGAQQIYGWSASEVIGQRPQDILQTTFPIPFEEIEAILLQNERWEGELTHATRKGTKIVVASRWSLQRDERGTPMGVMMINRDITQSKQSEARLKVRAAITSILAEADSLAAATPLIMQVVCECMHWQVGLLWGVDTRTQLLRYVDVHCTDRNSEAFALASSNFTFAIGIGLPGRTWATGRPEWIEEVASDTNFTLAEIAASCRMHGAFSFPIVFGRQVFGVLEFLSDETRPAEPETLELFASIGSQIGQFIYRKQSEIALRVSEERYRNLVDSSSALICTHDLAGIVLSINPAASRALGFKPENFIGKNIRDLLPSDARPGFDLYLKEIAATGTASGNMPVIDSRGSKRVWSYTNRLLDEQGTAPYVLGHALDITEKLEAHRTIRLAQEAALAMEKRLSRSDSLTGLANRRAFYESVEMERKRAARYGRPLSLAYIDLDNFKQVNDQNGHTVGDEVLVRVAGILRKNTRSESIVARLGGDEFGLLLPEANYASAKVVINKLHDLLNQAMQTKNWPVTFSVGMVTYEKPAESTEQMVKAADELMYSVKHNGKNRVASFVITRSEANHRIQ